MAVADPHVTSVVAADGLSKRDVFRLPDPFAVITVDAEQTHTTSVMKKTLNPYWNESFDMSVLGYRWRAAFSLTNAAATVLSRIHRLLRCKYLTSASSRGGIKVFWGW